MQYGVIKRKVLEYLDRYSVAGVAVSPAYNNQSDTMHRIPGLVNAAIAEIRDLNAFPKRRVAKLSGRPQGKFLLCTLPKDCRQLCTGGVRRGEDLTHTNDYQLFGDNNILVPDDGADYWVEYFQTPETLPVGITASGDPPDTYEFEEDANAIEAACVYAASWIAIGDDAFDHTALNNLYAAKMELMRQRVTAEVRNAVESPCAFLNWGPY